MNVFLIQPPDSGERIQGRELFRDESAGVSAPDWELICLHAHILGHTRHFCELVDTRLFADVERDINQVLAGAASPKLAVVHCTESTLPETKSVLAAIRRGQPRIPIAVCGPFPSAYPGEAFKLDEADFIMAGDPEPILRNLADYIDLPQRLRHTPGLLTRELPGKPAYWLDDLASLSLPEWKGINWGPYRLAAGDTLVIKAALSRGHLEVPANRACSPSHQPLREWPPDRFLACLHKCSHYGISRLMLADPPGFWTPERFSKWVAALLRCRNAQSWGACLPPMVLSDEVLDGLSQVACSRIQFLLPSCDPERLAEYGWPEALQTVQHSLGRLHDHHLGANVLFWVGGPEERRGEAERIIQAIRGLAYPPTTLVPFPYTIGSAIYENMPEEKRGATIDDITQWLHDPWTTQRPFVNWRGEKGTEYTTHLIDYIHRSLARSPRRIARGLLSSLQATDIVRYLEDKALSLITRRAGQTASS